MGELGVNIVGITTDGPLYLLRQAKSFGTPFPLLSDARGEVAQRFGALVDLPEFAPCTDRKTFVIGKDGNIENSFLTVGWELNKADIVKHIAAVGASVGGDGEAISEAILPRPKSIGQFLSA